MKKMLTCLAVPLISANVYGKVAISLSYDDALASQLDVAVPMLDKYGFKASFYVVPTSEVFQQRLSEWRAISQRGHELGNHSIFHFCQASKPNREWVPPHQDLDKKPLANMVDEVKVANTLLEALDGKKERTYTPPCYDTHASGINYIAHIEDLFVAIKGQEGSDFAVTLAPENTTASYIIDFIEKQPENIKLINIIFHGVGGDYLNISAQEHEKLLRYLDQNRDKFETDTYLSLAKQFLQQD